jgi:multidrug efflux pump subunit AcrA (membrane-fusion protein)
MHRDATTQANRIRALYTDSAATRAQLDAVETALARTEAGVRTAEAAASELGAVSSYAVIRAPFAGIVTKRYVDPGAFASPGAPLISVQDASQLRITASTTPDAARGLRRGRSLAATIEGRPMSATIEGVVPAMAGNLYTINALVPNPGRTILSGSTATLAIPTGERAALVAYGALSARLPVPDLGEDPVIALVGEKNLEYEADCHAAELGRLLGRLDLEVGLRFVREAPTMAFGLLPRADLLVLRERGMGPVTDRFPVRPGTPRIHGFPVGLSATVAFLQRVGQALGRDAAAAGEAEAEHQETVLARFGGLSGARVSLPEPPRWAMELTNALGMTVHPAGVPVPLPEPAPVGTAGIARLLSRWGRLL